MDLKRKRSPESLYVKRYKIMDELERVEYEFLDLLLDFPYFNDLDINYIDNPDYIDEDGNYTLQRVNELFYQRPTYVRYSGKGVRIYYDLLEKVKWFMGSGFEIQF